jgi:HAD superfamily hydrolase (TIGR01509 family)
LIKAILFDMDGVLIDAKQWHYEALNRALGLFGYNISPAEHLEKYDGLPTRKKLDILTLERGLPAELHEYIGEMKQMYTLDKINAACKPTPIHQRAVARFRAEGYKLAVCSNSVKETVETAMDKAGLTQYFEFMLSNQDAEKPKPDPEIYNLAINRLGFVPAECLIVEDNENGIKAAVASGAHLLKVNTVHDVTYDNIKNKIITVERSITR